MKPKFKKGDEFRLKKDGKFTRSFPIGGYDKQGNVRDIDKEHRRSGSRAKVCEIYDSQVDFVEPTYHLDFGEFQVSLSETQLLELFDPTP
jgi:hypothetical protein